MIWPWAGRVGFDTVNYEFSSGFGLLHGFGTKYALAGQLTDYP